VKLSVRWFLIIIGLIFAILSVASILADDDLLWGLDSFPHTVPPRGMGIIVGLAYISMLGSVGLLWFRAFVVKNVDRTSNILALWLSGITLVLHILLIGFIRVWEIGGGTSDLLSAEAWDVAASASSVRAVISLAIGLPIQHWFAHRDVSVDKNRWGVILGGLIALGSLTVVGHTAYQPPTWISHGMDFVHGVGSSLWFGGLLGLVLFMRHAFRKRGDALEAGRVLADFSSYALYCVIALAVSGTVIAYVVKDDLLDITGSPFARALTLKLGIAVIPIAIAAYNRFKLLPRLRRDPESIQAWRTLRLTTLAEVGLLIIVLLVTGYLVLQSPVA
jgi:copper transport protein